MTAVGHLVPTVRAFSVEFMADYAQTENEPGEIAQKGWALKNHLLPFFGDMPLDAVRIKDIAKYKAAKKRGGLASKTINNHLTVLSTMLHTAKRWEMIASVPEISRLNLDEQEFRWLNKGEIERLLEAAVDADIPWHAMIVVALNTGLRVGELLALRWRDLDFKGNMLTVRQSQWRSAAATGMGAPKNGRFRSVPLNTVAHAALKGLTPISAYVFVRSPKEEWIDYRAAYYSMGKMTKAAGLREVGWHSLRHTFASHLAAAGVPMKHIQELLGHSTLDMTMRYAHLSPKTMGAAVDVLVDIWKT